MKNKVLFWLLTITFAVSGFTTIATQFNSGQNLVKTKTWFIAGPAKESQETINKIRQNKNLIRVTANENPVGEIELNVTINPSETNDGIPANLSNSSNFIIITYKSSQLIKLQAREGNEEGTGCVHGGSHPRVDLPASPNKFTTLKIPWTNFKQDGLPDGKLLNKHNLCKFNFVNYHPVSGALLEIKSVIIQN
jgi:hypothetical protein